MSKPETSLKTAMASLGAATLEGAEHLSADELLAYNEGELAEEARDRIRIHLAWCSECARTVLDLASWPDVELRDPDLRRTAEEEAADWQTIRRRFAAERGEEPPEEAAKENSGPRTWSRYYGPVHLLAAVLLFAVVGLSLRLTWLTRQVSELTGPRANVLVIDLEAGTAAIRDSGELPTTQVPEGMETVVFLLVQEDFRAFDEHAVEVRDDAGRLLWQTSGLASPPEGGFSIEIPRDYLPSEIEIRLYGLTGGQQELLSTYRTRIESVTD